MDGLCRAGPPAGSPAGAAETRHEGNCRFWGAIGPLPPGLAGDHLRDGTWNNFKLLSSFHRDGWGAVSFLPGEGDCAIRLPLARRGGVAAGNPYDPDFDRSIEEMADLRPTASIVHIRKASSGVTGIPDPHPFTRDGFAFAHNGLVNLPDLLDLLTGDDPQYLVTHPPAYSGPYIDSELYFLWLLKCRQQHPDLPLLEALRQAVSILYARVAPQRLNFVLTRGDTLWACRCAGDDQNDPLRYLPVAHDPPSPFWVVCSTVVGSDSSGWGTFPPLSIGQFVRDRAPIFVPLMAPAEASGPGEDARTPPASGPAGAAGPPRPNPAGGPFWIPLPPGCPSTTARLEIWNAAGARVWKDDSARPVRTPEGEALHWSGRDATGREVPPGVYLCRVRAGAHRLERKITVVR